MAVPGGCSPASPRNWSPPATPAPGPRRQPGTPHPRPGAAAVLVHARLRAYPPRPAGSVVHQWRFGAHGRAARHRPRPQESRRRPGASAACALWRDLLAQRPARPRSGTARSLWGMPRRGWFASPRGPDARTPKHEPSDAEGRPSASGVRGVWICPGRKRRYPRLLSSPRSWRANTRFAP